MIDVVVFGIGVSAGAVAVFVPWIYVAYRKYVQNCGKVVGCPHHSPDNAKRLNDTNDHTRNGPTRPDIK